MDRFLLLCLLGLAATLAAAEPLMLAREWGKPLSLRQVTVIAPQFPVVEAVSAALKARGADVTFVPPGAALQENGLLLKPEVLSRTLLLIGGIHSNPALLPFYANYLAFGDARYPGGDGFTVRTVASPFGSGTSAVVLEASSPAGEAAAAARFAELLTADLALPPTLETHLGPEFTRLAPQLPPAQRYALTGDPAAAKAAAEALLGSVKPERGLADFGDYGIERPVREYAFLQASAALTAEDIQKLDNALFQTCVATDKEYWRRRDASMIGGRHQIMGMSCIAATVHLLRRRGNANPEAATLVDKWWGECEAYWRNACTTFCDDLEGIPTYYCPEATLDWALILGVDGYVRDQLPLALRRAYVSHDNLGQYCGTGTYEECRPGCLYQQVPRGWLQLATNYFHPGQGYDWLQANIPGAQSPWTWAVMRTFGGARTFAGPPPSAAPANLLGLTVLPLGEYRYKQLAHSREQAADKGGRYLVSSLENAFEKLCFRDTFAPDGQYLALEGFQVAYADNMPPKDANAILRYADLGHIWLHANTEKSGNLPRTGVFCSDGRNDSATPVGCELQAQTNGEQVGIVASHIADYTACNWTRNVIWRRGKYFVTIDLLEQNREGQYGLTCTFRTPQRAWQQPDGMLAREGSAELRVRCADGVRLSLQTETEIDGAAVPTLLRETQMLDGKPGDLRVFRNLFYAADPAHPGDLRVRPYGSNAVLISGTIRDEQELALIAATPKGKPLALPGLETDAQVVYVGSTWWAQAGGTGISFGKERQTGAEGKTPTALAAGLQKLWDQAKPAVTVRADGGGKPTGQRLWQAAPFTPLAEPVAAPVLTSEPAPNGQVETLFDRVVVQHPTVRWPAGAVLTLDLRTPQQLSRIDFSTGITAAYNTIPETLPAPRALTAEFSSDGFKQDKRSETLTLTPDFTFEKLHKGSVFPILRWTCDGLTEKATQVRLTFPADQWPNGVEMNELSICAAGPSDLHASGMLLRDVEPGGRPELIVWNDRCELAVLRLDGSVVMTKRLRAFITAVECFPGLGDTARLLVTCTDAHIYCLGLDGTELWHTDFLASGSENADLPCGYSLGLLKQPGGQPLIVVGNYNMASFVTPEGQLKGYCRLPAAFQTMTLPYGFDYDGDGKQETLTTEVWGTLSLVDSDLKRHASVYGPRGKGLLLEYWQPPTPERSRALHCTENGLGILDLRTIKFEWTQAVQPINACVVGDLNGDGNREIVLAKEDGYVLVLDEQGQQVASQLVGEPIRAAALVGQQLVLALPGRLVALGPDLKTSRVLAVGEYHHLLAGDGPATVLATTAGAAVQAIRLDR